MLKQEAKTKIDALNAQVCATSESTSASVIEAQQEEITKHPKIVSCEIYCYVVMLICSYSVKYCSKSLTQLSG